MIETAPPRNIDPLHEQLHRVRIVDLQRYKMDVAKTVTAVCGKVWEPTMPFTANMRTMPKCPACFPPVEHRFAIAC